MKLKNLLNEKAGDEDLTISKEDFREIPKELYRLNCDMYMVYDNKNLESLVNSPSHVNYVRIKLNPNLKSLKGFPKTVFYDVIIRGCYSIYHDLWRLLQSNIRDIDGILITDTSGNTSPEKIRELNRLVNLYRNQPDKILKFQNQLMDLGFYDDFQ